LQRTHAVAADSGQQAVSIVSPCPYPFRQPAADLVVVGKQIIEDGNHRIADVPVLVERKRQRHREGLLPAKPGIVVLKLDRPARLTTQATDKTAIHEDVERDWGPAARH
jgi:hypothetical protein